MLKFVFPFAVFFLVLFSVKYSFSANFISGSDTLENPRPSEQSIHTIAFTTTKAVPADGEIIITIPSVDATGQTNDGIADRASTTPAGGFDLNNLSSANIAVSSVGCANNWGVGTITEGTATSDHTIRIYRVTDSCGANSTITVTLGDTSKKMINPAPLTTPSTGGKADIYTLHIRSRDGAGSKLDQLDVRVAIVSSVSIAATVGETFSFDLSGVPSSTKICNSTTDTATTASSVPWGNITKPFVFKNAAHLLTVSTNINDGYVVTVSEDNQLKRSNSTCNGALPNPLHGCIPDTTCDDDKCTDRMSSEWLNPKKTGFGFSLQNIVGNAAAFSFNEGGGFNARQFPDKEAGELEIAILSGDSPTVGSSAHVCYRIGISDIQPAGYYTNHLLYTASPKF